MQAHGRRTGEIVSRPYTPAAVESARELPPGTVRPNTPFTLFFADGWRFVAGRGWVPCTNELWHKPGCNGVDKHGDPSAAIATILKKGHLPIEEDDRRLPERFRRYISRTPIAGGGYYYSLRSVSWVFAKGGRKARVRPDHQWTEDFHVALHDSGIVPDMEPTVLDDMMAVHHERTSSDASLVSRGQMIPAVADARLAEREAMLAQWVAWYEYQFRDGPRPDAPKEEDLEAAREVEIQSRIDAAVQAALEAQPPPEPKASDTTPPARGVRRKRGAS